MSRFHSLSLFSSSVSVYTLLLATDTLIALGSAGKPLDLSLINETALLAQERAQEAVDILGGVNFTLKGVASVVLLYADQLRQTALASTSASQGCNTYYHNFAVEMHDHFF